MTKIVIDAGIIVSAGLKPRSAPYQAILLARAHGVIVISDAVETEIRSVITLPKFQRYAADLRQVTDCRDAKNNKYLELAATAQAATIIGGDNDLLVLHPWRGIEIVSAADYVRRFERAEKT